MKYEWIDGYFLAKQGVSKDYKVEWDVTRYLIGEKMIAMLGEDKYKKAIITLKCEPLFGQALRDKYEHIVTGYYMNKQHWNSVYMDGDVPDDIMKNMIDMSYELVFNSLSKKMQKEIKGENNND